MEDIKRIQSDLIDLARFPLIVGVLLIHTDLGGLVVNGELLLKSSNYPFFFHWYYLFSQILARIAVPAFFFISGYLFFFKPIDGLIPWLGKIKKRFYSLFIPYVIWNLIYMAFYFAGSRLLPSLFSGNNAYTISAFFSYFWNFQSGMPLDYPLWFVRDLMIVCLFSYVIYWCIGKMKFLFVAILGLIWYFDLMPNLPNGFNSCAFFFFSLGAYFSIEKLYFIELFRKIKLPVIVTYMLIVVIELICCSAEFDWMLYLHNIGLLLGIVSIFNVLDYLYNNFNLKNNPFISGSVFFLFAYHAIPLALLTKIACKYIILTNVSLVLIYILSPAVVAIMGILFYYIVKRILPNRSFILTGGR